MGADIAELFGRARDLHLAGRFGDADRIYRKVLTRDPSHAESLHMRGILAHQAGRNERAVKLIRQAIAVSPSDPRLHNNLGNVLQALGRLPEAEECYARALAKDPHNADFHNNLGSARQGLGRLDEAVACYERAIALRPGFAEAHFNLAGAYHCLGQPDEAIACYERAIEANPGYAPAYNALGYTVAYYGHHGRAIECYRRALALDANYIDARYNLGAAYQEQGLLESAAECYQRVLALDAHHAPAHNNLGYTRFASANVEGAIAQYRRALECNPDYADAYNNLGYALQAKGEGAEARRCYERATSIDPSHVHAHNNLGNVLKEQGCFEEALACWEAALKIDPDFVLAHYNRADLKTFAAGDPGLRDLRSLAAKIDRFPPASATHIHFALAKALDDVGDYDGAFGHLLAGNLLKRRELSYDHAATAKVCRAIKEFFTSGCLEQLAGGGHGSPLPVFIVGMPRSGTSLVEQILASHPSVHGAGERAGFDLSLDEVLGIRLTGEKYPVEFAATEPGRLQAVAMRYLDRLSRGGGKGALRITDKLPANYFNLGFIRLALPNARIIHLAREPLDTCLSCFSKLFRDDAQKFSYDLVELGGYYRCYRDLMAHWQEVLPEGAVLEVRYESLVTDLEQHARRIVSFCDLEWDDRCLRFFETARPVETASAVQVRRPPYSSSIGRWKRYEKHLGPLKAALCQSGCPDD